MGLALKQITAFLAASKGEVPLKRLGRPEEVAAAVLFLASDATFVTGEELIVGGGLINI